MSRSVSAVLDIPPSPHQTSRNACGFPSCEKSLHPIFNPKAAMTSHYCSICQNIFCQRHTRYSPHGRLGSCGMESKCICQICFDDLPRLIQASITGFIGSRPGHQLFLVRCSAACEALPRLRIEQLLCLQFWGSIAGHAKVPDSLRLPCRSA